jgi:MFS transporter, PAT family, beta-lactamase induction signal transducer AmpG
MSEASSSMEPRAEADRGPWWWVPSLYFAEGVPYVIAMTVAAVMFKRLGVSNTKIALYTTFLYVPWVIKPLWSPLVQRIGTRRGWVVVMQLLMAAGLGCAALAIPLSGFLTWSLVALAGVALCSATHDVAADGFYLCALSEHQQTWFVGIRNTAYRLATIAGQGLLVMVAGFLESSTGLPTLEVEVQAVDKPSAVTQFMPRVLANSDKQEILLASNAYELSVRGRRKQEVQAIKEAVRKWNVDHGFYKAPEEAAKKQKWGWVLRLEEFIREKFGPEKKEAIDRVGDVAIVQMRMAQAVPPGQQQVVQFGRVEVRSDFDAVEGDRFVVTEANWNEPFAAVVQVDAKLDHASAAKFEIRSGNLPLAWSVTFFVAAAAFIGLCVYHFIAMPRPAADAVVVHSGESVRDRLVGFLVPFVDFFRKPRIVAILAFMLLYRFPEAQLVKLTTPFLLDTREAGGLALTTSMVGLIYGTVGVIMLMVGGIVGGFVAARHGLGRWLWPMALAMHLPNLAFLFLAYAQPANRWVITAGVAVEQFGYGFGFTAYMLYLLYVAAGKHQTVHYALCTGFMALGMMIPGLWSGWLQELIGYQHFYVWIMLAMIPSLLAVALIPVDPQFGKKKAES